MSINILKHLTLGVLVICAFNQKAQAAGNNDFVMQVKTDFTGSPDTQFIIRTKSGETYNYNVDCDVSNNNGYEATAVIGDYTCDYAALGLGSGTYFVGIEDNIGDLTGFPRIFFNNNGDKRKVTDIAQWGKLKWTSMAGAFRGTDHMTVTAIDVPDLSAVTDLSDMFRFSSVADPDTSNWDVSGVTTFASMFRSATIASPNTSNWDTSSATIMTDMFRNAFSANPDVRNWDVTGVTDMTLMFSNVTLPTVTFDSILITFESQLVQNNVTLDGGNSKFCSQQAQTAHADLIADHIWTINDLGLCDANDSAHAFVIEVDTTITGSTTSTKFEINTFGPELNYNVDCNTDNAGTNIATGQTSNYICEYTTPGIYTISISDNQGDRTGFPSINNHLHADAKKIINLKQWGTGIWTTMSNSFSNATNMVVGATDIPDLSTVTSMGHMFINAISANPNTSNWNTANITHMNSMFSGATSANPNTSNWNTANVAEMKFMFSGATAANPDTSNWNTTNVTNMSSMFSGATSANPDTSNWNTINVTTMRYIFFGATSANPDTSNWNITNVTNMAGMFIEATSANPDTSNWNTVNVTDLGQMFESAIMANPDTSNWNTVNVTNMGAMFRNAISANPNVLNWDVTSVTTMNNMFSGVTLPSSDYDAMLIHFNVQVLQSGIIFDGGNSKYCAVTAHNNLENVTTGHGWIITDAGLDSLCDDIIFKNSFEIPVTKFNAAEKQFVFDFSLLENIKLDTYPELISIGLDNDQEKVIKVHIRKLATQLQIRMSHFYQDEFDGEQWIGEQWQNIYNNKKTTISW